MANDEQDVAESLDEEVVNDQDDYSGEEVPDYPPERPLGLDELDEFDATDPSDRASSVGGLASEGIDIVQLYEDDVSGEAVEVHGIDLSPEEAAMHVRDEGA
jgi:hypothetical protein